MIELDGKEVKVGSLLWNPTYGWGKVFEVKNKSLNIRFENVGGCIWFLSNGATWHGAPRSLFWEEVKITPPKPKVIVKKWRWVVSHVDNGFTFYNVTKLLSETQIEARFNTLDVLVGRIKETEVEVEE